MDYLCATCGINVRMEGVWYCRDCRDAARAIDEPPTPEEAEIAASIQPLRARPFIPGQPTQEERIRRLEVNQRLLYLWLAEVSVLLHGLLRGGVETQPEDLSRLLSAAQACAVELEK